MNPDTISGMSATSSSLVECVRRSEPEAWQRFAKLYAPLVYSWARHAGLQNDDAADVVQEVFRGVSMTIHNFRRDSKFKSFRGWLYGVTRHKLTDHFRKDAAVPTMTGGTDIHEQLHQVAFLPEHEKEFEASGGFDVLGVLLYRVLDLIRVEFEDRTWQAFWRTTVDGRPTSEIADDLSMTKRAVRQAKYRVLKRLREQLVDENL